MTLRVGDRVPGMRSLVRLTAVLVLVAACNPTSPSGPGASTGAGSSAGADTAAPTQATSATSAASTAPDASAQVCAQISVLADALTKLKALDPMTTPVANLQAAAHDVGQAGVTLIVMGAKAEHLQALNIGAQLISSMFDQSSNATPEVRAQALQGFENTAQQVLDELGACS